LLWRQITPRVPLPLDTLPRIPSLFAMKENEPVDVRVRQGLRKLRREQGLTLQQVAERASIDLSTLSRLDAASAA
jgi:hypothetical protein